MDITIPLTVEDEATLGRIAAEHQETAEAYVTRLVTKQIGGWVSLYRMDRLKASRHLLVDAIRAADQVTVASALDLLGLALDVDGLIVAKADP